MDKDKQKSHQKRRKRGKGKHQKPKEPLPLPTISERVQKVRGKPSKEYVEEEQEVQQKLQELPAREALIDQKQLSILFFTSCIPDENGEPSIGSAKTPDSTKSPTITHTSPTHLASSYLAPIETNVFEQFKTQDYIYNGDLLFLPETNEEHDDEEKVINIDSGLYMSRKPSILPMNQAQMVNRCLEEGNALAVQLIEHGPTMKIDKKKTLYKGHTTKKFQSVFVKPEPLSSRIVTSEALNKTLNIMVHFLEFNSHPNLSENSLLVKKVKDMYQIYMKIVKKNEIQQLENKLEVLRSLRDQLTDELKLEACKAHIRETRNDLYAEAKMKKETIVQILHAWKQLKALESTPGFSITIHCTDHSEQEDLTTWDQQFQEELEEILEEEFEKYHKKRQEYKELVKENPDERYQKPKKPDIEGVKETLSQIWTDSFRLPGEPDVVLELKKDDGDLSIKCFNNKYLVKILVDNEPVTATGSSLLQNDFNVIFDSVYSLKLTTHSVKEVKFEIHELSEMKTMHRIAEVYAVIPASDEMFVDAITEGYEFSSYKRVKGQRYNGRLHLKLGWLEAVNNAMSPQSNILKQGLELSKDTIKSWHKDHLIDAMDPDAQNIIRKLNPSQSGSENNDVKPTFNFLEDELVFCSKEELDNNERLNMLIARWNKDLKFKDTTFVPLNEREIEFPESKSMFDDIEADPIDIQRYEGRKYLRKVYESITNYCETLHANRQESAILIGDQVPTFGSLSLTFFEIFGAKRPLKPTRRTPSSTKSGRLVELEENFSIIVTIVRAFGVPQRNDETDQGRRNSNLSSTNKSMKGFNVRPFVSVSIKDKSARTCTAEGFNPTWNEQLSLPVKSGFHKLILSVDLFDECIEDYVSDDRRITEVYQRWLGQVQFPLETIYQNQRIEGTFEMNTPVILFGYNRQNFEKNETVNVGFPNMREVTYLSLFINLEPQLELPRPLPTRGLECIELEEGKAHIDNWYIELRNEFPWRAQSPYVILLNGKKACITRLLGALEVPPFDGINPDTVELCIRRFVSLIPMYSTYNQCITLDGVWLTNEEIFNIVCASPKDLGVLLTCYYLALNKLAWLILGYALPVGDTCFVLLKEDKDYFIVDAMTGKKYESTAVDCPLKKIYSLANAENYWANIQTEKRVFMTQFDVRNSAEWRPMFKWSQKAPTGFLQNGAFQYKKSHDTTDLQKLIELKVMKKVNTWRSHRKTVWNRYVAENLKKILVELEAEHLTFHQNYEKHLQSLNRLFNNYKVTGYPLNFRYTNVSNIVNHVKCTGIYLSPDNAEFAVAAYIKEYANNIYSVWIFLASMTPK